MIEGSVLKSISLDSKMPEGVQFRNGYVLRTLELGMMFLLTDDEEKKHAWMP